MIPGVASAFVSYQRPKRVYGWLDRPSSLSGACSVFDFLATTKWWDKRRFQPGADQVLLTVDYELVASDFRRAYYRILRDSDVEPRDEPADGDYGQSSMFDRDEFRISR